MAGIVAISVGIAALLSHCGLSCSDIVLAQSNSTGLRREETERKELAGKHDADVRDLREKLGTTWGKIAELLKAQAGAAELDDQRHQEYIRLLHEIRDRPR